MIEEKVCKCERWTSFTTKQNKKQWQDYINGDKHLKCSCTHIYIHLLCGILKCPKMGEVKSKYCILGSNFLQTRYQHTVFVLSLAHPHTILVLKIYPKSALKEQMMYCVQKDNWKHIAANEIPCAPAGLFHLWLCKHKNTLYPCKVPPATTNNGYRCHIILHHLDYSHCVLHTDGIMTY